MIAYCNEKHDYTNIIPETFIEWIILGDGDSAVPMSDWVKEHDFMFWMNASPNSNKKMLYVSGEIGDVESALKNREYVYNALYRSGVKVLTRKNRGDEWSEWQPAQPF